MELRNCPYDASPLDIAQAGAEGVLLACPDCGAQWEWHNAHVRRIAEPDREAVRHRRAERRLDEAGAAAPPDREDVARLRAHLRR